MRYFASKTGSDGRSTPALGDSGAGVDSFSPRTSGNDHCDVSLLGSRSREGFKCLAIADCFTDDAKHMLVDGTVDSTAGRGRSSPSPEPVDTWVNLKSSLTSFRVSGG